MQIHNAPDNDQRRDRSTFAAIGGYIGFVASLLCVLSVASEFAHPLPMGEAALTVLVMMCAGYAVGWLSQPLLRALFPQL